MDNERAKTIIKEMKILLANNTAIIERNNAIKKTIEKIEQGIEFNYKHQLVDKEFWEWKLSDLTDGLYVYFSGKEEKEMLLKHFTELGFSCQIYASSIYHYFRIYLYDSKES